MTSPASAEGSFAQQHAPLPFPALVGLEMAQQALLMLAIEPRLRGVVLAAAAGTGKSSLARGLRSIFLQGELPFIELPAGIDIENLLGGIDVQASLVKGRMVTRSGVLARAHGGIVYVDGLNLLTDACANLLLAVLDDGEVRVEREGVSLRAPAHFSLLASYDPAEGQPRTHLVDRLGMIVPLGAVADFDRRKQVMQHNLFMEHAYWQDDVELLRGLVLTAREQLTHVTITPEQIRDLSMAALAHGVQGHRVDLFAVYAARASAAYNLRSEVEGEDLQTAFKLVILPRATVMPAPQETHMPPHRDHENAPSQTQVQEPQEQEENDAPPAALPEAILPPPEQILAALETMLPETLEALPFQHVRRGKSGSRGTTAGKRGRHVRSVQGDPKRARIDVVATLRAASPWQPLRAAAAHQPTEARVYLEQSDIRVKQYRSKAGALFCFVVDASGSMALHRMRQAKGAVNTLLMQAYVKRDRVALIAFRGNSAELLMPPSQSVELARRALDLLPTGGGTPLASALLLMDDVATQARRRGILQTVCILLTDGRANIPFRAGANPQTELQQIGQYLQSTALRVIIVDTKRQYLSKGEAQQLSEWLGGEYAYLPNASGEQIAELALKNVLSINSH